MILKISKKHSTFDSLAVTYNVKKSFFLILLPILTSYCQILDTINTGHFYVGRSGFHPSNIFPGKNGTAIITGEYGSSSPIQLAVIGIDKNGDSLWSKKYSPITPINAIVNRDADTSSDGSIIMSAHIFGSTAEIYLLKLNSQGDSIGSWRLNNSGFYERVWKIRHLSTGVLHFLTVYIPFLNNQRFRDGVKITT